MQSPDDAPRPSNWILPALVGGLVLVAFGALGRQLFDDYILDFSSVVAPMPRYTNFLAYWLVFGSAAAFAFALSLARVTSSPGLGGSLRRAWNRLDDRTFFALASAAAFAIPLYIRVRMMRGGPLTDDEYCYAFAARTLSRGHLWAASHPMRAFLQHDFMVNDGRYFSQYFLGWPALLAPGVAIGHPELINPLLSAATVPAIALLVRRLAGSMWARVAALVIVTSPMLMIAPATLLSHTACLAALSWLALAVARSRDEDAPTSVHAAVGALAGVAFFIRPTSTVGIGAPLLAWWALGLMARPSSRRVRAALAFAAPAVPLALLFLWVNKLQTGSFVTPAYQYAARLIRETPDALSIVWSGPQRRFLEAPVAHFVFDRRPREVLSFLSLGVFRFAVAFGWPIAWIFAPFAPASAHRRVLAASLALFCALHAFALDPGVDFFGPHHYFEIVLPFLVLTMLGAAHAHERLNAWVTDASPPSMRALVTAAPALVIAMSMVSGAVHLPLRAVTVGKVARAAFRPVHTVEQLRLRDAVIFAPVPFREPSTCASTHARHLVQWRPVTGIGGGDEVLWVNDLGDDEDRRFLATLAGRKGYTARWNSRCQLVLTRL